MNKSTQQQAEMHLKDFLAFTSLLATASPERRKVIEEERDRNLELYLKYSEGDTALLEQAGFTAKHEAGQLIFFSPCPNLP